MKKTNDLSTIVAAVMKIVGKFAEISLTRTCSYFCGVQHLFTCSHTFVLVREEKKFGGETSNSEICIYTGSCSNISTWRVNLKYHGLLRCGSQLP